MFGRASKSILRLFESVHALRSSPADKPELALAIQEELLKRISTTERHLRKLHWENKAIRARLAIRGNSKAAARILKQRRADIEERIQRYRNLRALFGVIGDSIAFIYIDRWDLKPLANHETAGFITVKTGARSERRALRLVYSYRAVAILNDVTNSLRFGDLTIVPLEGHFPFAFLEMKSGRGGKRSRTERQKAALDELTKYLASDRRQLKDGCWVRRVPAYREPSYHCQTINRILEKLPPGGWLHREVEPGLHYFVLDLCTNAPMEAIFGGVVAPDRALMVLFANDLKLKGSTYFPFLLNFEHAGIAHRFYNGEILITVIVDMEHVSGTLEGLGFVLFSKGDWGWVIEPRVKQASHPEQVVIGQHMIGRLGAEFLSLKWLIENAVQLSARARHDPDHDVTLDG